MRGSEVNISNQKLNLVKICHTILLIYFSGWRCNSPADDFVKCLESPITRVVVQPCQRAMRDTIEKVVAMIPNRNDLTEERLAMQILKQLRRAPISVRVKKVKRNAVFMQVRFPQIDSTSNSARRKHAFSLNAPLPPRKHLVVSS